MARLKWILGLLLVLIGIPVFPLPIPLGLPFIAGGLILMAQNSNRTRTAICRFLQRYPKIYQKLHPHLGEEIQISDRSSS